LRSLAALALLTAITVGIPVLLIAIAGWPLPRQLPHWDRVLTAIQQGDIPAQVVINTLAVIVWIAWAQLVWALGWELAVNLPRAQSGEPARPAPLVPAAVTCGVGRLVAVLFAIGLTVATTPTPVLARPAVPAALAHPAAAPAADATTTPSPRAALACWQVGEQDTLWDIAERALGDGARAPEILELNPAMRSARDLRGGQLLRLPGDAAIPIGHQTPQPALPDPPPAPAPTPPFAGYLAETVITIQTGDTLWDLSEGRLLIANGQPARPAATVAYLDEVIAANPDTIEDPNLIYAGEQFRFPAIGTPPPPLRPAEPPPAPSVDPPQAADGTLMPTSSPPPPAPSTRSLPSAAVPPTTTPPLSVPATSGPATGKSAAPQSVAPSTEDESSAPWIAGLAGATVLTSGLVLVYRRARNRAAVAGAANLNGVSTDARGRQIERALTGASNLPLVRWANHELAALITRLDPRRFTSATPVAVEISETRGIELLWTSPVPSAPAPWEATDGGWTWRILYDPDLPVPAAPEPAVMPGLVSIGQRDGKPVLVDLEALGSLAITGDPTAAENLARSMVVELASDDDLANSYVHAVGVDLDDLPHLERARTRDEASALELLQSVRGDHDALLERHRLSTTFQLRLGGTTGRELTVVVARAHTVDDLDRLIESATPHRGVALVLVGAAASARSTLDVDAEGQAILRPLGLHLTANRLLASQATDIDVTLREAAAPQPQSEPPEEYGRTSHGREHRVPASSANAPVLEGAHALASDDEALADQPHPEVVVRVLGVPSVDGHPSLGRIDLNLVTFLACSGGTATESQVIDAVWNGRAIERSTLWNRISKARAALGGYIPPRDQGTNLVRLAPGVTTDAELLRRAVEQAQQLSSTQAVDHLRAAMDLITGVPFDAVGYDWAHEQQQYADACQLIERAALMLVDLALDLDDMAIAKDATSIGLKALRVNEPLYRARMRIEAHCGNRAGIRHTYDELVSLLAELDDGSATYSPTHATTALLDELLRERRRTA
jgi:nucleoid-associated protein YgaU